MSLIGTMFRYVVERSAKNKSYEDLIGDLQKSGEAVAGRLDTAADTPKNIDRANHIIGIERWGQRRLSTALGQTFISDEYDGYRPGDDKDMPALRELFGTTRQDTLELAADLQKSGVPITTKIAHNDMGELTIGAWLTYFSGHGDRESRFLKK